MSQSQPPYVCPCPVGSATPGCPIHGRLLSQSPQGGSYHHYTSMPTYSVPPGYAIVDAGGVIVFHNSGPTTAFWAPGPQFAGMTLSVIPFNANSLTSDNKKFLSALSNKHVPLKMDMPLVGFRSWQPICSYKKQRLSPFSPVRHVPTGFKLRSIGMGNLDWKLDGPNKADCRKNPTHTKPEFECECGFHALRRLDDALHYGQAVGAILMWGRVIDHTESGYRSEYARVLALLEFEGSYFFERECKIPVFKNKNQLLSYCSEFGAIDPK